MLNVKVVSPEILNIATNVTWAALFLVLDTLAWTYPDRKNTPMLMLAEITMYVIICLSLMTGAHVTA